MYIELIFINTLGALTIMSNRINKQKKTFSKQSLVRKIHLLRSLSSDPFKILSYNHCVRLKFLSYKISPLDSSHCVEYIRKTRSDYNVLNISFKQLLTISTQHLYTKAELKKKRKTRHSPSKTKENIT